MSPARRKQAGSDIGVYHAAGRRRYSEMNIGDRKA